MGLHFKEEHLKNLTSSIKYDKFEHTQNACNNVNFYSEIEGAFDKYPKINVISKKIQEALCFMYNRKKYHDIKIDDELCSYFYYWLGHNILQHLSIRSFFSSIIKEIYDELNMTDMVTICNPLHKNIDENTFRKYKLLFDYSNDHNHVNLNIVHAFTTCDKPYREAIQKYIHAYMDVYEHCNGNTPKKYDCGYFNKLFNKDEHEKLKSFNCGIYKEQIHTTEPQREHTSRYNSLPNFPPSEIISSFAGNDYPQVNQVYNQRHRLQENNGLTFRHEVETDSPLTMERTPESGTSKTIAGSVAPVLGVSSFSLLLYKVTPLGGFIRNFLGRNRNMYNPVEYMDSFNPYNEGMDPGGRTMNISYHRL
ncbi:VIR protein [Plasmodium vivax]|uniref:VIR protein n=1 Tax=Plasmodium vivax TaxID=5855 RepID=A0A1G4ECW0_PLAVI|nr:VIR protein [Plasmodium vivax]